jgi:uncharacterized membrane protein YdjX (TVP38/TMEM64 family)
VRRIPLAVLIVLIVLVGWAVLSYSAEGFIYLLVSGTPDQQPWLDRLRDAVASWGRLAPLVYTGIVVVEVVVAPIPGTLLYAPGGAIFGGLLGGTLSLVGNVIGAAISCVLGGAIGERLFGDASAGEIGRRAAFGSSYCCVPIHSRRPTSCRMLPASPACLHGRSPSGHWSAWLPFVTSRRTSRRECSNCFPVASSSLAASSS